MAALLDPKQVAAELRLTAQRVGELARAGTIKSALLGKVRRFRTEDVERFKADLFAGKITVPAAPRSRAVHPQPSKRRQTHGR